MDISRPTAFALTVALRGFIQDTVVATVREVTGDKGISATILTIPVIDTTTAPASVDATPSPPVAIGDAVTGLPAAAAGLLNLPVGTGGAPRTQLYGGITYNIPASNASGPYYWVTRGRRIGVFSSWCVASALFVVGKLTDFLTRQQTSSHVIGVSRASFSKVRSIAEGMQLMENAIDRGETELLV